MRILFFNNDYWPTLGGVEVQTRNLAHGLRDRGHAVAVAANLSAPDQPEAAVVEGIEVRRFRFDHAIAARDDATREMEIAKVTALKEEFQPDIVHVNIPGTASVFHLHSITPGQISVVTFHCALDRWPGMWPLARNIAARADAIVVPSHFLAGNIAGVLSRPPEELRVIEHGIPEDRLLAIAPLSEPLPKRFLFAGRLVPLKGPEVATGAIAVMGRRGITAELRMAGSGALASALSEGVNYPELTGRLVLLGPLPQDRLAEETANAAALVVPSVSKEAFSLISAEAALAGRPVLASRRGALAETVVDGETGLLFEPGNPEALADVMQRILFEPELAIRLGAAARERARSRYRLSTMVDRYEDLYRELAERSARRIQGNGGRRA